jgi:GST-like protein
MIDLYYWTTPNGHKITMFLEETGLKYKVIPVNIGKGEQFKPDFLAVSPNNRIPALVDHEPKGGGKPVSVFESGAMLVYLAEKTGKFLAASGAARYDAMQWLFWQMGNLGPMSGQNNHFSNYANDKIQYAMDRYRNEVNRLYGVMDTRLAGRDYLAGDYSIADMACYPWVVPWERQGQKIDDFPHLKRWLEAIKAKPATERAYALAKQVNPNAGGIRTEEEKRILFGQTAQSIAAAAKAAAGAGAAR